MKANRNPSLTKLFQALVLLTAIGVGSASQAAAQTVTPATLPPTPNPPQANQLPGANKVPDLSSTPGAPEIQGVTNSGSAPVADPAVGGSFSEPFAPPGPNCPNETEGSPPGTPTEGPPAGRTAADITCKPAAVNIVVLPDGRILYWDGLEAEEDVQYSEVLEFGDKAVQDQSRILSLDPSEPSASSYTTPVNPGGGPTTVPTPNICYPTPRALWHRR
jgi:hypothetical protein